MAHFAKLDENNIVERVEVVNNPVITDSNGVEQEQLGIDFLRTLYKEPNANWKQTSYNNNFRKQYAGIGFTYDETNDVFIVPKPFASWTLDSNFDWQPPVPYPTDGKTYYWEEETLSWILYTPEQPFDSWTWNETNWQWQPPTPRPSENHYWNENNQNNQLPKNS